MATDPAAATRIRPDFSEIGRTGLNAFFGMVEEEVIRELRGGKWKQAILEMQTDPTVGAILHATTMLARQVSWKVDPGTDSDADAEFADFVRECLLEDMSVSWPDLLSEILTMLPWGWAFFELVYKRRDGKQSKFADGRIGWRKFAPRAQETLYRWEFDPAGGLRAFVQQPPPDYALRTIPIEKGLLFRTSTRKGNPEGVSVLRAAYTSWYYKRHIQRIEAIGIERDLAGLPVAKVPPQIMREDATSDERAVYEAFKRLVTSVRRDEQEGVVIPQAFDADGHPLYELELLSAAGSRQIDLSPVIERYDSRMAMSVLADFVLLGHQQVGSFALASSKTNLFALALGSWLDAIAEVVNTHAIPRLLRLNGMQASLQSLPVLRHGDVQEVDPLTIADVLLKLSQSGAPVFPNREVLGRLFEAMGLPVPEEDASGAGGASTPLPIVGPLAQQLGQSSADNTRTRPPDVTGRRAAPVRTTQRQTGASPKAAAELLQDALALLEAGDGEGEGETSEL